jgi:hypothetical protein
MAGAVLSLLPKLKPNLKDALHEINPTKIKPVLI